MSFWAKSTRSHGLIASRSYTSYTYTFLQSTDRLEPGPKPFGVLLKIVPKIVNQLAYIYSTVYSKAIYFSLILSFFISPNF